MSIPSRATRAGRAYLDLRKLARESQRPVDELLHLYVLEAFLDRLASTPDACTAHIPASTTHSSTTT